MAPVAANVLVLGSKSSALARRAAFVPSKPPATSTLPDGSNVAV
jgi:hypothetical protein